MTESNQGLTVSRRQWSLLPTSFGEAREIANLIAGSEFAPKGYKGNPESVILAIQMGADVGLSPMQSLQNIAVINGRPALWGDGALAVVMPVLESFEERFEGEWPTDTFQAVCVARRRGWPADTVRSFSIAEAKLAGLWKNEKKLPWVNYPKRMLQMRARGFTLRDCAADRLMGLAIAEEALDIPRDLIQTDVVELAPQAFEALPEAVRENIERAFESLQMAPGLRIAKLKEFVEAEGVDPEEGATALLAWCRDEYAKRKTGKPVKRDAPAAKAPDKPEAAPEAAQPAPPEPPEDDEPAPQPAVTEEELF